MVAPQLHNVDIEDMAPNSGATVQKGLRKVAVYKDEEGKKHAFSALCPQLGCLLQVSVWGLPSKILPFVCLGCLLQLGSDACCVDSCTLSLFGLSFAQQVSGRLSVVMLWVNLTVLRLLCMLWSHAIVDQSSQSNLKGWSNFKG